MYSYHIYIIYSQNGRLHREIMITQGGLGLPGNPKCFHHFSIGAGSVHATELVTDPWILIFPFRGMGKWQV